MQKVDARAAIRAFMKENGLNTNSWCKLAHVSESGLRGFLAGRTKTLNTSTLMRLAEAAHVSIGEIIGEEIPPARERGYMVRYLSYSVMDDGWLEINTESGGMPMAWRKSWVEQYLDSNSNNGRLLDVKGDTFTQDLHDGDLVCMDLTRTDPARDPGIYCFWDKSALFIRRVQMLPGRKMRMLSEDERYMPVDVGLDDVQIIGRVVWRAGGM